jgi:hypothetical protein
MKIIKKHLTKGQYIPQKHPKKSLFLHHTAGASAHSAWRWWNSTRERVGTAYLIDRDGTIYECFDPMVWAYHLGIKGDNNFHEKHGLGIEFVSMGRLTKVTEGVYKDYVGNIIPEHEVCKVRYKNQEAFHDLTAPQIVSAVKLMGKIKREHPQIPFPDDFNDIFKFRQEIIDDEIPGVYSHGAVRKDKDDLFPQPQLIQALNEAFNPGLSNEDNKSGKKKKSGKSKRTR